MSEIRSAQHQAASIASQQSYQYAHQTASVVSAALLRISTTLGNIKDRLSDRADVSSLKKIIEATEGLQGNKLDKSADISNKAVTYDGASEATPEEKRSMGADWREAQKAINDDSSRLSADEMKGLVLKMNKTRESLGNAGLAGEVFRQNIENIRGGISKEYKQNLSRSPAPVAENSNQLPAPQVPQAQSNVDEEANSRKQEKSDGPESSADDFVDQRKVVAVSEKLVNDSERATNDSKIVYRGEQFDIAKRGDHTVIMNKHGETLFSYQKQGNKVTVTKDEITNHKGQMASFDSAHAAIKKDGLESILSDSTGRSQFNKLRGLSPDGTSAIALASVMLNKNESVYQTGNFEYRRSGNGFMVIRNDADKPRDQVVACSDSSGRISGSYKTHEERNFFVTNSAKLLPEHEKRAAKLAEEKASGKPIKRQKVEANTPDRGGR